MSELKRRLMISVPMIGLLVGLIIFSQDVITRYVVSSIVATLAGVAAWEYGQFAKKKGGRPKSIALIASTVLVTSAFFPFGSNGTVPYAPHVVFLVCVLALFALHFRDKEGAVIDLAVSVFGLLYIALPIGMILGILYMPMEEDGRIWVALLLCVTKITDVGAYFGGTLFGRRKLAPQISPKKTVEGAFFGLAAALGASFVFFLIGERGLSFHMNGWEWIVLGVVLGVIGQFGDLAESLLKRDANKKDSNILPGIGGVLDAVDSLLFNAPIVYFYLLISRF